MAFFSGLAARDLQMAMEKQDMPWYTTRRTPAPAATAWVKPRKKSETSTSGGGEDWSDAMNAAKGSRSSVVARRNDQHNRGDRSSCLFASSVVG
uniref:Uncharacterized protein n=1 Tax=Leersia perrieri TaxID=77586 RepID=A0A0D9WRN3_9ORYZ